MERRTFISLMGSMPVGGAGAIELKAFAAARLPHSVFLYADAGSVAFDRDAIYEIRCYEPATPDPAILARHGIAPLFFKESTMVIGFKSLAVRDEAWNAVSSDKDWQPSNLRVTEIGLYRLA